MIKILLVEDHKLVRQAWRTLLSSKSAYTIVGEAESGAEALELIRQHNPDIILLDINLKGESGNAIIPTICNILPHPKIIVVSMNGEYSFVKNMFKLGVKGYITKNAPLQDMLSGIEEVARGKVFMSSDLTELFRQDTEASGGSVSIKEIEVLRLIARGYSNKTIAQELGISEKTVEGRKTSIYRKLKVKNNVGLVKYASQNGLL